MSIKEMRERALLPSGFDLDGEEIEDTPPNPNDSAKNGQNELSTNLQEEKDPEYPPFYPPGYLPQSTNDSGIDPRLEGSKRRCTDTYGPGRASMVVVGQSEPQRVRQANVTHSSCMEPSDTPTRTSAPALVANPELPLWMPARPWPQQLKQLPPRVEQPTQLPAQPPQTVAPVPLPPIPLPSNMPGIINSYIFTKRNTPVSIDVLMETAEYLSTEEAVIDYIIETRQRLKNFTKSVNALIERKKVEDARADIQADNMIDLTSETKPSWVPDPKVGNTRTVEDAIRIDHRRQRCMLEIEHKTLEVKRLEDKVKGFDDYANFRFNELMEALSKEGFSIQGDMTQPLKRIGAKIRDRDQETRWKHSLVKIAKSTNDRAESRELISAVNRYERDHVPDKVTIENIVDARIKATMNKGKDAKTKTKPNTQNEKRKVKVESKKPKHEATADSKKASPSPSSTPSLKAKLKKSPAEEKTKEDKKGNAKGDNKPSSKKKSKTTKETKN